MELKEALLQSVSCMLSQDNEVRRLAEERQKALEVTDDYSLYLAEILLTTDEALDERQMAGILLTKYVKTHWRSGHDEFIEPIVSDVIKKKLRAALPNGLCDPTARIQNAVASTLAMIAVYDFPDIWTDMTNVLTCKLASQVPTEVAGGLRLLYEFLKVACKSQILYLTPSIYEYLYKVCMNEVCATANRTLAISITSTLITTDYNNSRLMELPTLNAIQHFCELLLNILYEPFSVKVDYCLKSEVYRFLFSVHLCQPNMIRKSLDRLIPMTWDTLNKCQMAYLYSVVDPNAIDFSYQHSDLLDLICNLLRFFQTAILQSDVGRDFIYKNLPDVLCKFIVFMSIAVEQEMHWFDDEETFFNDHSGESIENNIRLYVRKVFITLAFQVPDDHLVPALEIVIAKILEESRLKIEDVNYWVRTQESLMYMIQTMFEIYMKDDRVIPLNIKPQLSMWTNLLGTNYSRDHVFFYVRIILLGSTLSKFLDREELILHMNTILNSLSTNNNVARMAGLIALERHCQEVKQSQRYVQEFTQNLKNIAERVVTAQDLSPRLCFIMLQCIQALLEFDKAAVPELLGNVVPLLRNYFWKNLSFPGFDELYFRIIKQLSKNSLCVGYMQDIMLPEIIKIIMGESDKCVDVDYQNVAVHVLKTIIEHAPTPISQELIEQSANCMYRIILTSNECLVISTATICIAYCIAKAPNQVCAIRSPSGKTGLDFVMDIIGRVLDPTMSGLVCISAGRLCLATLKFLKHILTPHHIDIIIKSTLTRMNYFNDTFNDGLLVIFIYLFHVHTETLINTLSIIPGPLGDSALDYILQRWVRANSHFIIPYECRLSILALMQVMQYGIQNNDNPLFNVSWHKRVNPGPEHIPLLAKILEILLSCVDNVPPEQQQNMQNGRGAQSRLEDTERILSDEDEETKGNALTNDSNDEITLEMMIFKDYISFDRMSSYVAEFLQTVSHTPSYQPLLKFLNESDKSRLRSAGIGTSQ